VTAVVGCAFLEGGNAADRSAALSCDSRGRLVYHNVSAYLSITNFLAGKMAFAFHSAQCASLSAEAPYLNVGRKRTTHMIVQRLILSPWMCKDPSRTPYCWPWWCRQPHMLISGSSA
jgi:hypothetical protein